MSLRRDPRAYLWDVREAANAIVEFTDGISEASYAASAITHSAVERKFEVIGEALNLLSKIRPRIGQPHSGTRQNCLVPKSPDPWLCGRRAWPRLGHHAPGTPVITQNSCRIAGRIGGVAGDTGAPTP